ncbi:MAG: cobalamin B12-binding domain-containing protein [Alphaproteobacteria bacterium]|jgi:methylmalonyl-CoA mutase C-terminal domain/subunit|nr:cobalamin B12-binding domain-containing protein [Alphaproteobacteria bacterium]
MKDSSIRVLLAKPGLDSHESGIKMIAAGLRDAGMEVIYLGVFQSSESIVSTALEEDVDVIGLSYLSGGHQGLTAELMEALKDAGLAHVNVICGGIIPDDDHAGLKAIGVKGVYGPGTPMAEVAEEIESFMRGAK